MPFATSISRSESSLLIVDQCEQAFAADDPAEIREFFDALSQMVFRGMLVVAIRADRLGDLADHEGFAQIIQSHMLMLTALEPRRTADRDREARRAGRAHPGAGPGRDPRPRRRRANPSAAVSRAASGVVTS